MDFILSDECYENVYYGMESVEFYYEGEHRIYYDDFRKPIARMNMLRRANDYEFFIKPWIPEGEKELIRPLLKKSIDTAVPSLDLDYVPDITKEQGFYEASMRLSEGVTRIILGDIEVNEYDELLNDWYEHGGETYIKNMNEHIKNYINK
jgi:putative aldouronate transport system substrate-binding protein